MGLAAARPTCWEPGAAGGQALKLGAPCGGLVRGQDQGWFKGREPRQRLRGCASAGVTWW
jgi:hypothetical protein